MGPAAPVMMIGLDAAELTLVERLCDEGKLPTLAGLRRHGCFGSLESEATILAGGVWPTFYTGKRVPWHGIYQDQLWRFERCGSKWRTTVGSRLHPSGRCSTATAARPSSTCRCGFLRAPRSMNGVMISGWGTHDRVFAGIQPRGLAAELRRECGPPDHVVARDEAANRRGIPRAARRHGRHDRADGATLPATARARALGCVLRRPRRAAPRRSSPLGPVADRTARAGFTANGVAARARRCVRRLRSSNRADARR